MSNIDQIFRKIDFLEQDNSADGDGVSVANPRSFTAEEASMFLVQSLFDFEEDAGTDEERHE